MTDRSNILALETEGIYIKATVERSLKYFSVTWVEKVLICPCNISVFVCVGGIRGARLECYRSLLFQDNK